MNYKKVFQTITGIPLILSKADASNLRFELLAEQFVRRYNAYRSKSTELRLPRLDYSVASLKCVDLYVQGATLSEPSTNQHELAIELGAYVGEVVRRKSQQKFDWISLDHNQGASSILRMYRNSDPRARGALLCSKSKTILLPIATTVNELENTKCSLYEAVTDKLNSRDPPSN